jgi:hypothetical protein
MHYVVVKGRKEDYGPMPARFPSTALSIGLFLSKDPAEGQIIRCLRLLLSDDRVTRVVLRPHPVNLWSGLAACVASFGDPRLVVCSSGTLLDDLERCDLVLGGNSTVLLDAVVAGRPACYVRGFDHGPYDVQGFVRDGLIYEWLPRRPIEVAPIEAFYNRPGWSPVLRRYADIDRSDHDMASAVRAAVNRLAPLDSTSGDIA